MRCKLIVLFVTIGTGLRADRAAGQVELCSTTFTQELVAIGVPADLCEAWRTEPALAVEIDVTEVFHQTPGPGAGEKASS